MEPDLTKVTRNFEEMMRRQRNLGAVFSVLGALGLFAMVYLFVPAEIHITEPLTAERIMPR